MNRLRYKVDNKLGKLYSNLVFDSKGEGLYQIIISKLSPINFEICTTEQTIYVEYCRNVTEAKRKARKKLQDLGVKFRKEIRFKKHETKRKQLYQKTRSI
jgi:NifB/MoaA-like Fe-S oxidoreductase